MVRNEGDTDARTDARVAGARREDPGGTERSALCELVNPVFDMWIDGLENPEHALNGLLYSRENWYELANWGVKYRRVEGRWSARRTGGGGQWGLSQDDLGRLFFNTNSDPLRVDVVNSAYGRRNHRVMLSADDELRELNDEDLKILCDSGNVCYGGEVTSRSEDVAHVSIYTD